MIPDSTRQCLRTFEGVADRVQPGLFVFDVYSFSNVCKSHGRQALPALERRTLGFSRGSVGCDFDDPLVNFRHQVPSSLLSCVYVCRMPLFLVRDRPCGFAAVLGVTVDILCPSRGCHVSSRRAKLWFDCMVNDFPLRPAPCLLGAWRQVPLRQRAGGFAARDIRRA